MRLLFLKFKQQQTKFNSTTHIQNMRRDAYMCILYTQSDLFASHDLVCFTLDHWFFLLQPKFIIYSIFKRININTE